MLCALAAATRSTKREERACRRRAGKGLGPHIKQKREEEHQERRQDFSAGSRPAEEPVGFGPRASGESM